jgi:hypothetical protein
MFSTKINANITTSSSVNKITSLYEVATIVTASVFSLTDRHVQPRTLQDTSNFPALRALDALRSSYITILWPGAKLWQFCMAFRESAVRVVCSLLDVYRRLWGTNYFRF